jgi:Fe2+ or Zn2+ uptake regulation protein
MKEDKIKKRGNIFVNLKEGKKRIEKAFKKQANCKHQFVAKIFKHVVPNLIGSKAVGHLTCRKCGKTAKLHSHITHTESEWKEIDQLKLRYSDFE